MKLGTLILLRISKFVDADGFLVTLDGTRIDGGLRHFRDVLSVEAPGIRFKTFIMPFSKAWLWKFQACYM